MKKTLLYTFLACTLLGASASAGTFKVPDEDFGIASVAFPDNWKPKEIEKGVEGSSPDGEAYIAVVAVGSDKGLDAELADTQKMLDESKVTIDASTKKVQKFKLAGLDATEVNWQGKQGDEAQSVSVVFVPIKGKTVVITYWVSATGDKDKADSDAIGSVLKSLKAL